MNGDLFPGRVANSPLKKALCRRSRVIMAEDNARDRAESGILGGSATQVFGLNGLTPVCVHRTGRQSGWTLPTGC